MYNRSIKAFLFRGALPVCIWVFCLVALPIGAQTPRLATSYISRGNSSYEEGKFADAISDYEAALAFAPDSVTALTNRGAARLECGDIDGAIADFSAALKINP